MRVLLPIIFHSLTECIARAFEEEGHTVHIVDWRNGYREKKRHETEDRVIAAAKAFKTDFAFCQFQTHGVYSSRLPKYLKSIGCFSVNWTGDVRSPLPDHYMEAAPYFDVTAFTNGTDVDTVRAAGYRSEFLQIGYCERTFNTDGAGERSGVVFLGNNYGSYKFAESDGRREMVKAMAAAFPDDFKVYGTAWEGIVPAKNCGGYLHEPDSPDVLRRALIALGYDHFHRPGFASDRILRATACGCSVVNQYYEGIETEHPSVRGARSIDEMVTEVSLLLRAPQLAMELGSINAENTLKQHRWNNRVRQMMTWLPN